METSRRLKLYIRTLNLFPEPTLPDPEENSYRERTNIIATRIYLVLLFTILFVLTFATSLLHQSVEVVVPQPSRAQFESFPNDAQCPCSQVSLSYGQFLSSHPSLHRVCSSDFVSEAWISSIYFGDRSTSFRHSDFRRTGFTFFQTLATLCRLSESSVKQNLTVLVPDSFITPRALSPGALVQQALAYAKQYQLNAPRVIQTHIEFLSALILGILPLNGLHTSILPILRLDYPDYLYLSIEHNRFPRKDGTWCTCITSPSCEGETSGIYSYNISEQEPMMIIPGLRSGCMPVDGCLRSTLECFFDQTCVNTLRSYLNTSMEPSAMVHSPGGTENNTAHFDITATVASIVAQLMVEDWGFTVSYEKYYELCSPKFCSYLIMIRNDASLVIGKTIGLLGGLCAALGFIVPFIVLKVRNLQRDRRDVPQQSAAPPSSSEHLGKFLKTEFSAVQENFSEYLL